MEDPKRKFRRCSTKDKRFPETESFHRPIATELPCPTSLIIHQGLGEFCLLDSHLTVQKTLSGKSTSTRIRILKAHQSWKKRPKTSQDSSCFTLDLTSNAELDNFIDIPPIVKKHSLFHKYWPLRQSSNFFLPRSKVYHAFQDRYKSSPYLAYGGLTEWIYLLRGRLKVTIIKPTESNLARFETLTEGEDLLIEPGTYTEYSLREYSFLSIPAGHISIKSAIKPSCALGGELLHSDDLVVQLGSFKKDVRWTNGRFGLDRDAEIRHLYWFYTIHVLDRCRGQPSLDGMDSSEVQALRAELADWSHKCRMATMKEDPYLPPSLYAPTGIQVSAILRDIRHKKPPKREAHEANTSQASDGDQTMSPDSSALDYHKGMQ